MENLDDFVKTYAKACAWRADPSDVDWKPTRYKDKATGQFVDGKPLAYLSWAVAWRAFKEFYPDGNYRLIETPEGLPLWNCNGYGLLKIEITAMGVSYIENYPIMDGHNDSIVYDNIDARNVNDNIQRGVTKAIARFGVGAYIFEGKLEGQAHAKKTYQKPAPQAPKTNMEQATLNAYAPTYKPKTDVGNQPLSVEGVKALDGVFAKAGITREMFTAQNGFDPYKSNATARQAVDLLKKLTK